MAELSTFVQRATNDTRRFLDVYEDLAGELAEYQAMGGGSWTAADPSAPSIGGTDFTVTEIDQLMGAIASLKTFVEANAGYFYKGSA